MHYHAILVLPGDRRKSIINRSESGIMTEVMLPFLSSGVVTASWGKQELTYQVLEVRIYRTENLYDKKKKVSLEDFVGKAKNLSKAFEKKAERLLGRSKARVFIVMPIQGEKLGNQEEQRIYREFDERFEELETALGKLGCVAIRIDKEHALEDLVGRIKSEIKQSQFVIADLTDERPSCYFEAGYAEALGRKVIYISSKQSVMKPGVNTKIHFDIHMNVLFFSNHEEMCSKVKAAVEKNKDILFTEKKN